MRRRAARPALFVCTGVVPMFPIRHVLTLLIALLLTTVGLVPTVTAQVLEPGWQSRMTEIVVELDASESPRDYAPYFLSRLYVPEAEFGDRVNHVYTETITGFSVYLTQQEWQAAQRLFSPGEMGVQVMMPAPEFTIPDLSLFGITSTIKGKPLKGDGLIVPNGLLRTDTPLPETPGQYAAVDVAVIDTGIDASHGQLTVVGGIDCTAAPEGRKSYGIDPLGHGTHVAGTIAASYSANGVVGMAPGARLWDIRVLDANGGGSMASIICGIEEVARLGIPVANMSLGGSLPETECGGPDPLHNAICIASEHTTFVVAAGNSGEDASTHVPASYPEVVTVSAFTDFDGRPGGVGMQPADRCSALSHDDEQAAFSNFGPAVDIAAPGVCVLSTASATGDDDSAPTYVSISGTSMATPHVTGAFARWLALHGDDEKQREHMAEVWIDWSCNGPTGSRYDGSHADTAPCLLYVGEMPGEWEAQPDPDYTDPVNVSR